MPKNNRGDEGDMGSASESRGTVLGRTRGNAANLSREARVKGGQRSAQVQTRDERGQFAGRAGGESRNQQRRGGEPNRSGEQQDQSQSENR
jgi:hypothetical protein